RMTWLLAGRRVSKRVKTATIFSGLMGSMAIVGLLSLLVLLVAPVVPDRLIRSITEGAGSTDNRVRSSSISRARRPLPACRALRATRGRRPREEEVWSQRWPNRRTKDMNFIN